MGAFFAAENVADGNGGRSAAQRLDLLQGEVENEVDPLPALRSRLNR